VDIEDRSEPGGFHPGGAKPPADRYRIRIWVLTPEECAELHGAGPDAGLLHFRSAIASCRGTAIQDGVLNGCNANDCSGDICTGLGTVGTIKFGTGNCPVRKPNIDDGGPLQNGNHQIHPQIKPCDATTGGPGLANSDSDCSGL